MNPTTNPESDPQAVNRVLELLRQWGWEAAESRLRLEIEGTPDERQRAELEILTAWITAERGGHKEAEALFEAAGVRPELKAWTLAGRAFVAYRDRADTRAQELLHLAAKCGGDDTILRATIHHIQAMLWYKTGRDNDALESLYAALEGFGLEHFGTARVLDSLGMVYGHRNDFATAVLFYQRALETKRRSNDKHADNCWPGDLAGLALTYGQLGRLYMEWHFPDRPETLQRAADYFREDLRLCERINDNRGAAQMYNHLGQVELLKGEYERAREYLDASVRMNQDGEWAIGEALARKDRATALIALGQLGPARDDLDHANKSFMELKHDEGLAYVMQVRASLEEAEGRHREAEKLLRRAASWFADKRLLALAARAYLKLARLQLKKLGTIGVPREALLAALEHADQSRRDSLINEVERELAEVDEVELYKRVYRRARGRGIRDDIGTLESAVSERATVMFLDLRASTELVMKEDAAVVRLTLNQLFAVLTQALEKHHVVINQYLGDGFMALSREGDHARNAVAGALDVLQSLERFNRPRRVLGLKVLEARIGISSGDVVLGNIGTHQKIDFTAVGPATNQAARLQGRVKDGLVCISEMTHGIVKELFEFADAGGRKVENVAGVGDMMVWDVTGRK